MIRNVVLGILALIFVTLCYGIYALPVDDRPQSTVKVLTDTGHGSGVHIGDGFIVTAAHVISGRQISVKLSNGSDQPAQILWVNIANDIALIRTKPTMQASNLSCRSPHLMESVTSSGNPMQLEFITTTGKVSGVVQKLTRWESVFPLDVTIVMGMSGGPVFDTSGNIVGINVGVMNSPLGITGIGLAVPGITVCELIARR